MPAKLRPLERPGPLGPEYLLKLGGKMPPLVYANLDFNAPRVSPRLQVLLRWIDSKLDFGWSERRTIAYLKKQQPAFQRALEWIARDAITFFDESIEDTEQMESWEKQDAVQFFQQHGLDHGGVKLAPQSLDEDSSVGLHLTQKRKRDPLDAICWYVLASLMDHTMPAIRRCPYEKCGKFFQPRTARKLYCGDRCRASDYMSQKSPQAKRKYMRKYRAILRRRSQRKPHSVKS